MGNKKEEGMFKIRLIRLEPEIHAVCTDTNVYEGYMWGEPIALVPFFVYQKRSVLLKDPKYAEVINVFKSDDIPILRTSSITELVPMGPKTMVFKTFSQSVYKLEILDEDFSFPKPYSQFSLGGG